MTLGIPRALIYWKRPHFWETFFEELGFEVLLSPKTNKEIVEMGVKAADPETCFSQKVYWGHLLWLDGKIAEASPHLSPRAASRHSVCDLIFVPRLKAVEEGLEYCPKFFGLPDLGKILVETPILTEIFDERKRSFEKTLNKLGKKLNKNSKEIEKSAKIAFLKEEKIKKKKEEEFSKKINSERKKIVLVSHPYNLYDDYVNLRMKEKLEKLGAEPIFIDEVPIRQSTVNSQQSTVKFHWEFGKKIMEKIQEILKHETCPVRNRRFSNGVVGAIQISSFACGCDAVLKEFVEKEFKQEKIPFLYLLIDEQTGEAGIQTRLEAFIDTLK